MKYIPYDYQSKATDFIVAHPISALLLDMGMGKSSITLTAIKKLKDLGKIKKVLIIAPIRVAKTTWKNEILKWDHLKCLTYSIAVGDKNTRLKELNKSSDIYIINRENVEWLVNKSNIPFDFDTVVIDELSSFKDYNSKRFKALISVRPKIKRIVGLTGTPTSNGIIDLFGEYKVLDQGKRLGNYISYYRKTYFTQDSWCEYTWYLKPGAEEKIYKHISDITISMKALDHLKMPKLIINDIPVELDSNERRHYKEFKRHMVLDLNSQSVEAINNADLSGKLLQMANGSIYDGDKNYHTIHDKKLDALEDLIEQANGKNVLVAYWFQSDRDRILKRFPNAVDIRSEKDIDNWNNKSISIGLIHPQSCGHGLNLQDGGSILVWFSLTWSLELYEQTNARLYRQGQKDTVIIYHIITKDTIDEAVLDALKNKSMTQQKLIDAVKMEVSRDER